jgi:micrococcal nuclease
LDPDGNELACETLPINAFGPVLWSDSIPAAAEPAQITSITDGDTFAVTVNGVPDTIRMYHIDTPETSFEQHCGGTEATNFLTFVLSFAPNGTVYLEYDETERDDFDRRLAYVWYQIGSDVYQVNEVMVRNGWAESKTFQPDVKYRDELNEAEQFSVDHVLGVRLLCGKFGQPVGTQPSSQQVRQAQQRQPNQGQFAALATSGSQGTSDQQQVQEEQPDQQQVQESPPQQSTGNCDPSYPGVCIPPRSQVGDLDCGDVSYRRFAVVPPDSHNFDGDFDGVGCESG